jgi:hypothetical protein
LNTAGRKSAAEAKAGSGVISGAEEIPWGQDPRKLHSKAIFLLFLNVFLFFITENRQRMFATRAVEWTNGLPMVWTGLTRFTGLRDRMQA